MPPNSRIQSAMTQIKRWMLEHDAPLLVENLAPGATPAELAEAESKLGFPLPPELRDLWAIHNGQNEEQNGFVESFDLLSCQGALFERESTLSFIDFLRQDPASWKEAGVTREEAESDRWVPFAGRGYADTLVVSGVSGAVFTCAKDAPPLHRIAGSLTEWLEAYAARVVAGDYSVEEGFGDYYLELRDRDAEREEEEHERRREEEARYRRKTPMLKQVDDVLALPKPDPWRAQDVFERAAAEKPEVLPEAVERLFRQVRDPQFIATALQVVLHAVTLSPAQWRTVMKGGELLGNNAIRDIAARHLSR